MRRRIELEAPVKPRPCDHPVVTVDGVSAAACYWGHTEALPIPVGTPEGDLIEKAHSDHIGWVVIDRQFKYQPRAELLFPDGSPYPDRHALWTALNA